MKNVKAWHCNVWIRETVTPTNSECKVLEMHHWTNENELTFQGDGLTANRLQPDQNLSQ